MTETESMPASAPAEQHTQPAAAPASHHEEHYEQPAHESSPAEETHYDEQDHDEPEGLGDIMEEQPKKLSGAARAKLKNERLQEEIRQEREVRQALEQRIAEFERFIGERDQHDRQSEAERQAEARRQREEAHLERVKGAKSAIKDFDVVMRKMQGALIHQDLLEDVLTSDKSDLIAYHLASNPATLEKLNRMPERERVREIGRLEASLKRPEGKKRTSAPPPPSKLNGGAAPHNRLEDVGDMKEFSRRLMDDLAKRSGRRPGR